MDPSVAEASMRAGVGLVAAIVIALLARRAGALTSTGASAAMIVGTASVAAGWSWGALLILFFVTGSALSHISAARAPARRHAIVEKHERRDAAQVLANGGVFAAAALGSLLTQSPTVMALGAGSLAAATADTFATEIGAFARGDPRSIFTGRRVPAGTSGGVTWLGTSASVAGASLVALGSLALGWPVRVAVAALVAGVIASIIDSLLGATVQARRWCRACSALTERPVHDCGAVTHPAAGIRWLGNDAVNVACTLAGGLLAAIAVR
jgi:uncharacterized protein (TIGR00297 family)